MEIGHRFINSNKEQLIHYLQSFVTKKETLRITPTKKVAFVLDFDFTLSSKFKNGKNLYSSFGVFENSSYFVDSISKINEVNLKYRKLENEVTIDEKLLENYMNQWVTENYDLYSQNRLNSDRFEDICFQAEGKFYFRYGVIEFFDNLEKFGIPIIIMSAGVYETITKLFEIIIPNYNSLVAKGLIQIIANRFIYDSNGDIISYETPLINTFNKSSIFKYKYKFDEDLFIVLIGDHLQDSEIISQIKYKDSLKISFFNYKKENEEKIFEELTKRYDMIIEDDGDFTAINSLINEIYKNDD